VAGSSALRLRRGLAGTKSRRLRLAYCDGARNVFYFPPLASFKFSGSMACLPLPLRFSFLSWLPVVRQLRGVLQFAAEADCQLSRTHSASLIASWTPSYNKAHRGRCCSVGKVCGPTVPDGAQMAHTVGSPVGRSWGQASRPDWCISGFLQRAGCTWPAGRLQFPRM